MKKTNITIPETQANSLAERLINQIQKNRKDWMLPPEQRSKEKPVDELMASPPEVRIAFVRQVVAIIAKMGARQEKVPAAIAWFHDDAVPSASCRAAEKVLRKQLPFTDDMLAEMLEQIAGMEFLTFAPVLEQLVRMLEKRALEKPLPPHIRKSLPHIADGLLVKHWPEADARNWGMPRAIDRKIAGRIQGLLTGPLDLGD